MSPLNITKGAPSHSAYDLGDRHSKGNENYTRAVTATNGSVLL